jgi:hypothetical protein
MAGTPDRKVTTYQSQQWAVNLDRLTVTSEYEEGVLICVSPESRELILSLLSFYGYWGSRWKLDDASPLGGVDENTIIETVDRAVVEVMNIVGCETDLKRIADVLVDWYDSTHFDFFEFKALLEASGLEGIVNWIEALEEIGDLLGIIPDVNVKIPVGSLLDIVMTTLYRRRQFAKWDDTNAQLRGLIMSESGPSASVIIEGIQALIPGGNVVDNILGDFDEVISTIPASLVTLLLGNYMTNRVDDVAEAIKDLEPHLEGSKEALVAIGEKCDFCGASGGCGCEGAPAYGDIEPEETDQPGLPGSDPPPAGFASWPEYFTYKCSAANRMVDDYISTLLLTGRLVQAFAAVNPSLDNIVNFLAVQLSQYATVGLMRLGYNTGPAAANTIHQFQLLYSEDENGGYFARVEELAELLALDKEAIVCDLFEAETSSAVASAFSSWQTGWYDDLTYTGTQTQTTFALRMNNVRPNLLNSTVRNVLFEFHQETDGYPETVDCDDCESLGCTDFYSFDDNSTGWGFQDISSNGGSAQGEWDEAAGALRVDIQTDGSANSLGRGRWAHGLGTQIPYGIGATITVRYPASEDAELIGYDVWVTYTDASEENNNVEDADAGELTLTLTENKTVESFAVGIGRSNGAGGGTAYDLSGFALDVCVTLP